MKLSWETPELVTLYRGSPDEHATADPNCKHNDMSAILPDITNVNCNQLQDDGKGCGQCHNCGNSS